MKQPHSKPMRAGLAAIDALEREALQPPASLLEQASPEAQRLAYQLSDEAERRVDQARRVKKLFKPQGAK